jgi:hypothetical protein
MPCRSNRAGGVYSPFVIERLADLKGSGTFVTMSFAWTRTNELRELKALDVHTDTCLARSMN